MRAAQALAGAAVLVAVAASQHGAGQDRSDWRDTLPPEVAGLVAETGLVPVEFGTDILLRIATSQRVSDADAKRELIERAYDRASAAHDLYRRTTPIPLPDSPPRARLLAYDTRLDRVSLQTRAALAMIPLDVDRAREMFEWIDPRFESASCDDWLVPAADEYYGALTQLSWVMSRGDALARDIAVSYLGFYLGRARLPSELPAAVRSIRAFNPNSPEAVYLDGVVRFALEHGLRDVRGFSTTGLDLVNLLADLVNDEREAGLSPIALVTSLRKYLVDQFRAGRCADSADGLIAATFNSVLKRPGIGDHGLDPIALRDVTSAKVLGVAKPEPPYWRTGQARGFYERLGQLRGTDRKVGESVPRPSEWQRDAELFLHDMDRWTGFREPDADFFYQKSVLLALLFDAAPQAALRARALRSLVELMQRSYLLPDRPELWFLPVSRMLQDVRGPRRRELLDALDRSGLAVLMLYAHADRIVPPPVRK